ncbi:MAG: endolytic transglycosylase MltG [Bacteroidales bacterium]|nr:endolytic transglycosylase MltG [Bacteroidales bacterium]
MKKNSLTTISKIQEKIRLKPKYIIVLGCIALICICLITLLSSKTDNTHAKDIYIYPGDKYVNIKQTLQNEGIISSKNTSFAAYCKLLSYDRHIKAGHYVIKPNTSVFRMVRKLKNGNQTPVNVVINSVRTAEDFSKKAASSLMMTEEELMAEIKAKGYQYDNDVFEFVIPDTYQFYWNVSPKKFLERLKSESDRFWNDNKQKAKLTQLTRKEIVILASIVNEETNKNDEKPVIAGVYLNRLHKGMMLQADPTVRFAVGDFTVKRITAQHLKTESPFNTYKNLGLPPSPICLPSLSSINAVLKYKKHNYLYFCAKEDFSGYHNFAATDKEHIQNAIRYRKALNARGIK